MDDAAGTEPAVLSLDMVGDASPLQRSDWTEKDVILFALGVGASLGDPLRDLQYTTENSEGVALKAVPGYLSLLAARQLPPRIMRMDRTPFLHGEQALILHRPIPVNGPGWQRTTVEAVLDKGRDGLLMLSSVLFADPDGRERIGEARWSIFIRGGGGFGGPRGEAGVWSAPPRPADRSLTYHTRPEQALVYRLSGDRHRLHSDPAFARSVGFDRPILHGLCTFGIASRALVEAACGGEPERLAAISGRFARPVYPGDDLTTELWFLSPEKVRFRMLRPDGEVAIDRGEASVLKAA
jgi:acyl dehydratase